MFLELVFSIPRNTTSSYGYCNVLNPKRVISSACELASSCNEGISECCGAHILFSSRLSLIFLFTMDPFDQSSLVGGGCAINVAWLIPDPVARSAPPCTSPTIY